MSVDAVRAIGSIFNDAIGRQWAAQAARLEDTKQVSALYEIAKAMQRVELALDAYGKLDADVQAKLDAALGDYDFLMRSKQVEAIADEWQDRLDAEDA